MPQFTQKETMDKEAECRAFPVEALVEKRTWAEAHPHFLSQHPEYRELLACTTLKERETWLSDQSRRNIAAVKESKEKLANIIRKG